MAARRGGVVGCRALLRPPMKQISKAVSKLDSGMDTFRVTLHLAGPTGERFTLMEALVDTGASYTWIPRDVLEGLGVRPDEERVFVLADGRAVRYPIAWVRVRLDERTQPTLVVCGDSGTEPLLGAFTLEGFGLGVYLSRSPPP